MLDTQEFGKFLRSMGLKNFVGVPCSYLAPLINDAINEHCFIMANNEGDAVAIASGISIGAGAKDSVFGAVLMQNSGLSNALSPLTSLNHTFSIPILGFVSLRGERDCNGKNTDEPQHELLGVITDKLLHTCEITYMFLESFMQEAQAQVREALKILNSNKSVFFIVRDKTFNQVALTHNPLEMEGCKDFKDFKELHCIEQYHKGKDTKPSREEALRVISTLSLKAGAIVLATTGKCGRELYEIGDYANQLYMVGSMGCVSSLGLGIALSNSHKVIAIDGDSALLMRLGALSTNAYYARNRDNFCHILLDNQSHDSTGGQFNLSPCVDFAQIAAYCGYAFVYRATSLEDLKQYIESFLDSTQKGAYFIYVDIARGSKENLGRPKITPKQVKERLMAYIAGQNNE